MKRIDEMDEREISLATKVFDFDYKDINISDEEKKIRKEMYELFCNEIDEARSIIWEVNSFPKFSRENKISFCLELLRQLAIDNYKNDTFNQLNVNDLFVLKKNTRTDINTNNKTK